MAQIEMRISASDKTVKGMRETATDNAQEISDTAQLLFFQLAEELNPAALKTIEEGQA